MKILKKAVAIHFPTSEGRYIPDEFRILCESAGYEILCEFSNVKRPRGPLAMSSQKAEEIREIIDVKCPDAQYLLIGTRLTPVQYFKLQDFFSLEVLDKMMLVLEIFEEHAQTEEAKLEVRLARLEYQRPFQKRQLKIQLGKQRKGAGSMPFTGKGIDPVELLDLDIQHQKRQIEQKLEKIRKSREERRKLRLKKSKEKAGMNVALVGYTSAGKSTLLNALTGSSERTDKLFFTTLDTRIRKIEIDKYPIFLIDTIGFIEDLPPFLFKSFKSTLEESLLADIILVVIDVSEPLTVIERKLQITESTLVQLEVTHPRILVLNKKDLIDESELKSKIQHVTREHSRNYRDVAVVSALKNDLTSLHGALSKMLPSLKHYRVVIPEHWKAREFLFSKAFIENEQHDSSSETFIFTIKTRYSREFLEKELMKMKIIPRIELIDDEQKG